MLRTVVNIFKIPDLRSKILFTIFMLVIFRVGSHIPVPGFQYQQLTTGETGGEGALGRAVEYMQMLTGGMMGRCTLFGLGIMPYITASIILMLLAEVWPALKKLRQEGQTGYKKINEYTRYLTVVVCVIQAMFYMKMFYSQGLTYSSLGSQALIMGIIGMTAGTVFLMWLGEQIDEYGIGNGISLIIMAGIVARLPWAVQDLTTLVKFSVGGSETGAIGPGKLMFLVASFVFIVAGVILITQAQRRIPIQQAKQMRGMRMYGGQRHYLPLRVNHGGVMPIIFASSFMMFVPVIAGYLRGAFEKEGRIGFFTDLERILQYDGYVYCIMYMILIVLFAYFWVSVQFQPKDMAKNLQDSGSFIPGLRPGRRTAEYLETVMGRVTFYGGTFLAIIAVVPDMVTNSIGIPHRITNFLGGTGLLIVVSVSLDLVQRIEANLLMRSYEGFSSSGRIKGAYA
jgi:preprotein translocase subunit SecY